MIVFLPAALFIGGLLIAYGSAGWVRQAATVAMIGATTWSLALLIDPGSAAWAIGPVVATVCLPRARLRVSSSFEVLTRRSITIAAPVLAALFLASRLRVGESPLLLSAVPWFVAALGAAWFTSPIDELERLQGQVLMVAAVAAVILAAVPAGGALTAGIAGATALLPVAGERMRVPGRLRPAFSSLLLLLAAAALATAAIGVSINQVSLVDFSVSFSGPSLLAVAIMLVAGVSVTPIGTEWAAFLGVLAVIAIAPGVRWSALAALIAVATVVDRRGELPAWIAAGVLAVTPVLLNLGASSWNARAQAVGLGCGLILMLFAARLGSPRALLLPATTFTVLLVMGSLNPGNLVRFQWVAAVGGILLIGRALVSNWMAKPGPREIVRDQLILGLLLLAIGARDSLGLGELAVALLVLDLVLVRVDDVVERSAGWVGRLVLLARSNWPPSVTFAGATLAVIAALQAGLALGLLAALMLAGLQLTPMLDRHALAPAPGRPRSPFGWVGPALTIACGILPALVLRMLRL